MAREVTIPFAPRGEAGLPGLWDEPQGEARFALLLAHGAGAPMDHPFLTFFARAFAEVGGRVLRFDYPYMAQRREGGSRRPPDRQPVLLDAHRAALDALKERTSGLPLFLAGKSMGGRMASQLATEAGLCAGLVLLGYPLHPPKKPERLRIEHWPELTAPTLFVQGTRDALCERRLLESALERLAAPHRVVWIEDGDHSLEVRRSSGRSAEEALQEARQACVGWLEERL
jgi:predicted alpha/beta-hydrolase family hydrolase